MTDCRGDAARDAGLGEVAGDDFGGEGAVLKPAKSPKELIRELPAIVIDKAPVLLEVDVKEEMSEKEGGCAFVGDVTKSSKSSNASCMGGLDTLVNDGVKVLFGAGGGGSTDGMGVRVREDGGGGRGEIDLAVGCIG